MFHPNFQFSDSQIRGALRTPHSRENHPINKAVRNKNEERWCDD